MIQGILINKIISMIAKQFKLDKILSYVENDNELDHQVKSIEKRLNLIEKMAHPEKEFVRCKQCKEGITTCGEESLE